MQAARYDRSTIWDEKFAYKSSGAIGPHANLNAAYLNTANLRNADLSDVNFLGAYLSGADLTGANLQNTKLSGATLQRAFLTGASLRNARLNGVNLAGVDLRAADLSGVEMENLESIAGADFSDVQGLSDNMRSMLLRRSGAELDTWNVFTRRTTRQSLTIIGD